MTIADKTLLVTGANRGLGQSLVEEALRRGAKRVYAGTRRPFVHSDERVTALTLDVTDAAQIQEAVRKVESLEACDGAFPAVADPRSRRGRQDDELIVPVDDHEARTVAAALNKASVARGIVLAELHLRRPSLESQYLAAIGGER
jgi:NAD(P)-dependent dehydrogenase (short-subunit alcohol dehydrogenase family)